MFKIINKKQKKLWVFLEKFYYKSNYTKVSRLVHKQQSYEYMKVKIKIKTDNEPLPSWRR
jgi:hypothetical protein